MKRLSDSPSRPARNAHSTSTSISSRASHLSFSSLAVPDLRQPRFVSHYSTSPPNHWALATPLRISCLALCWQPDSPSLSPLAHLCSGQPGAEAVSYFLLYLLRPAQPANHPPNLDHSFVRVILDNHLLSDLCATVALVFPSTTGFVCDVV
jgi:hypothetical protein